MIEYLYDAIRVTAGTHNVIAAKLKDDSENPITDNVILRIHLEDHKLIDVMGDLVDDTFFFTIPSEVTEGLHGRFTYCFLRNENEQLCFQKPIYFI